MMAFFLVAGFLAVGSVAEAGFFTTVGRMIKERQQMSQSSRNVAGAVKALYRERKSVAAFAQSAATLVAAYRGLTNKASAAAVPKLLEIARAITTLANEYVNLSPKVSKLYKDIKPDLDYFATLREDEDDREVPLGTTGRKILLKSLSDKRINKLAGAHGWSRVWGAIKDDPMNLFRWGRLKDEYQYGKVEGQYVLKCAQIAFETESYYQAATASMNELLGIRNEINGILNGNLDALLGIGNTINRIQGAVGAAESLSEILNAGVNNLGTRFEQLNQIQEAYVKQHQTYVAKYGQMASQTAGNPTRTTTTTGTTSTVPRPSGTAPGQSIPGLGTPDLATAMAMYQTAYQEYIRITQDPDASPAARTKAIANLQKARNLVETLKARSAR
ncbi:MAG: hypothetical protein OZSIB_3775 [Candidatus Ozemobacter sibiricus]|jgi:hypothetical protein|uniref:Uncharacterized protein n=1 Tax=Candidatus Ozemobacter sibiricus TaxID=2268124 RepID=A0A367ZPE0_9BACT|nr:MAG: hypothetical protein OZSIB_3775 [Candidatus Ozemobacter sibiricus]